MEKSICWSWRESWTDDGERGRHGLQNSRTTTFRCETRAKYQRSTMIQKIENHLDRHALQQDLRQNQSFNPSVQNQRKWFRMWATSNYVNCSRRNPKRSAQYVYHTGTLASSIARAGTSCVKEEGRISKSSSIRWTFLFRSTSSRKDDLTDIDMVKSRETGNTFRPTSWRRNARNIFLRNPWQIHTRWNIPSSNDWKRSRRRCLSTMGCSCRWRSYPPFDPTRILSLQK